jgi:hypothetical protein
MVRFFLLKRLFVQVLPTPVSTGGLPVHLDGQWELKKDRNSLVLSKDVIEGDKVRAEWNHVLLTKVGMKV